MNTTTAPTHKDDFNIIDPLKPPATKSLGKVASESSLGKLYTTTIKTKLQNIQQKFEYFRRSGLCTMTEAEIRAGNVARDFWLDCVNQAWAASNAGDDEAANWCISQPQPETTEFDGLRQLRERFLPVGEAMAAEAATEVTTLLGEIKDKDLWERARDLRDDLLFYADGWWC
ncbi:MAG: hypothetical protein Q9159_001400 [Coniocarpon cinnabarinum]